ncbi:Bax inhibitor-1/YccA family protein [Urbifossiella limnaea]|uniref:Inhibitor of apoptosis-promoting Bax1 n=1 Tax=Urbifossiella limnaea TaxID=2528023 RepID=A0A517XYC0_9BACT|nr:Bax inhibitor-1 family protein [Urbifossiella limnaea]QDU22499.1 Inhibitor of apoptosis-promoting Bax1 [Urbifossiella limnaea]
MSYAYDDTYGDGYSVASRPVSERAAFIKRTYLHLGGAVLAFVAIEAALISSGVALEIVQTVFVGRVAWIGLMVLFIGGGYVAQYMARSGQSVGVQYAGLSLYVLLEVLIFLPILTITQLVPAYANVPMQAGMVTLLVCGGLTAGVFLSGKDFSWMGPIIGVASMLALGLVIAAVVFGFNLGLIFSVAMVGLAAAAIIYQTSNVMHHYGPREHVAASLALFASVATMFYYVLRIFMASRDN